MFWNLLAEILASIYDFAVNIVTVINIAINKTFSIHDSVKTLFTLQCFGIHKSIYG